MFNKLILIFFLFIFSCAQDKTYIFEAKGQFAEELKTLVEKYSKEENISITVHENKPKKERFLGLSFFDDDDSYGNILEGKTLYAKKCLSCHGEKGNKKAYGKSKIINKMSRDDILMAINGYLNDGYGGQLSSIMAIESAKVASSELDSIIAYILDLNKSMPSSKKQEDLLDTQPTQGTYLK